jgi:hypothetical protein
MTGIKLDLSQPQGNRKLIHEFGVISHMPGERFNGTFGFGIRDVKIGP